MSIVEASFPGLISNTIRQLRTTALATHSSLARSAAPPEASLEPSGYEPRTGGTLTFCSAAICSKTPDSRRFSRSLQSRDLRRLLSPDASPNTGVQRQATATKHSRSQGTKPGCSALQCGPLAMHEQTKDLSGSMPVESSSRLQPSRRQTRNRPPTTPIRRIRARRSNCIRDDRSMRFNECAFVQAPTSHSG